MLEENKFSYRALLHGKDAEWYFARGLDDITAAGSYEVRLFHDDMESLGITTADCDKEHYVVAHLFVSESAATGKQQALRVVGQTLLLTICATNAVKAFTRTCEITLKGASWGSWVDLGAASTTDIQDGSITPQKLSSDIRTSVENPLRPLFVAAGAEYNDTGVDKIKTAPWGETVIHKAGHYYLNGIGDLDTDAMVDHFCKKDDIYQMNRRRFFQNSKLRTFFPIDSNFMSETFCSDSLFGQLCFYSSSLEVFWLSKKELADTDTSCLNVLTFNKPFALCSKLRVVMHLDISSVKDFDLAFKNCISLNYIKLKGLKANISFPDSALISQESIRYLIFNASPTSAITITLHPDAYARLADDVDVVAALEAQPLVSLVSA